MFGAPPHTAVAYSETMGDCVGVEVGFFVGAEVGFFVGAEVGFFVGADVGFFVGEVVGFFVGAGVGFGDTVGVEGMEGGRVCTSDGIELKNSVVCSKTSAGDNEVSNTFTLRIQPSTL